MEDLSEAFGLNQRASALDPETVSETDVSQARPRSFMVALRVLLRGSGTSNEMVALVHNVYRVSCITPIKYHRVQ